MNSQNPFAVIFGCTDPRLRVQVRLHGMAGENEEPLAGGVKKGRMSPALCGTLTAMPAGAPGTGIATPPASPDPTSAMLAAGGGLLLAAGGAYAARRRMSSKA